MHTQATDHATQATNLRATQQALAIGFGQIRHVRTRPQQNAFRYGGFCLRVPMHALANQRHSNGLLGINRAALISFYARDHGLGDHDVLAWLGSCLAQENIVDADGEIWLQAFPRVLGYAFKPVSFWFCHRAGGALRAVVVEVHNTFGQRHVYVLPCADEAQFFNRAHWANKALHVSPFCQVQGSYRFCFVRPKDPEQKRILVSIDYFDGQQQDTLIHTSWSAAWQAPTPAALLWALLRYPLQSFGVMLRIHWQALRLYAKRVPFFGRQGQARYVTTEGYSS